MGTIGAFRSSWRGIRQGAAEDRAVLIGIFILWSLLVGLLAAKRVNGVSMNSYAGNLIIYGSTLLFFLVPIGAQELLQAKPDRPISFLYARIMESRQLEKFMRGMPIFAALIIFLPVFSAIKSAIPIFNPYTWDAFWIAADRSLHGDDPWRLLQPILGYPIVTAVISLLYHLWILIIYAGGVYFCFFESDRVLARRYFISYFAIWALLGVGCAIAFASVGPSFVGPLLGNHYFDAQMAYLHRADLEWPILVLDVQENLIRWHRGANNELGSGITAMPSMHVAVALLFAMAISKKGKVPAIIFYSFFVVTVIGSVHLAYHYALDGYVSIVATLVLWRLAAIPARRMSGPSGHIAAPRREATSAS